MTAPIHDSWTIARSAILTHQKRLSVTANNIANVDTPGYHRKVTHLSTVPETPSSFSETRDYSRSAGVTVADVSRVHNAMTLALLRAQTGDAAGHRTRADALGELESLMREEGDSSLGERLNAFWNSWHDLANQADNIGFRSVVIQRGVELAGHLRALDNRIDTFQSQIFTGTPGDYSGRLMADVDRFNRLTDELRDLNARIGYSLSHFEPHALMDRRETVLRELSELGGVTVQNDGALWLDGLQVVSANGSERRELVVTADEPSVEFALRDEATPPNEDMITIESGHLTAWADVLGVAEAMRERLDQLAVELADAVNTIHNSDRNAEGDSYTLDGVRSDWDFFTFDGPDSAATIAVNPVLYDPANPLSANPHGVAAAASRHDDGPPPIPNPGDGARALQIADLADAARAGLNGQTFGAFHATGQSALGGMISTEKALADDGQAIIDALTDALQSETGVNLDEELMDMVAAQRAFQAAGRLLQTVDEMMITILQW